MTTLYDEIMTDPLSRGYSGMTDEEVANDINSLYRTIQRDFVYGHEIFNITDDAEYGILSDTQKSSWDALCAIEQVKTASGVARSRELELFGPGTITRTNLQELTTKSVSRAEELGLGIVKPGYIEEVRRG
jgi:hypothetical protein